MIGRRHFVQGTLLLAAATIITTRGEAKPEPLKPVTQPAKPGVMQPIPPQPATPDYWMNDKVVKPSVRSALEQTSKASGLARTWLYLDPQQPMPAVLANVVPDAAYLTSIGISSLVVKSNKIRTTEGVTYAVAKRR